MRDYVEVIFACRRAQSAVMQRSPHPHWGRCHFAGLSSRVDAWPLKMECNFWMTKLSSSALRFVIFCQRYRFCKLVNIVLRGEGSGLDHFPFIALLHVSVHLTVHCFGERHMSCIILLRFGCPAAVGKNNRRMTEVKQSTSTPHLSAGPSSAAHCLMVRLFLTTCSY